MLLQLKANMDTQDPLKCCAKWKRPQCLEVLMRFGAGRTHKLLKDGDGKIPYDYVRDVPTALERKRALHRAMYD